MLFNVIQQKYGKLFYLPNWKAGSEKMYESWLAVVFG